MGEAEGMKASEVVTRHERQYGALILISIGLVVFLAELGLYFYSALKGGHHELDKWVLLAGIFVGYVGFLVANLEAALKGGGFLSDVGLKVLTLMRTGKLPAADATEKPQ